MRDEDDLNTTLIERRESSIKDQNGDCGLISDEDLLL